MNNTSKSGITFSEVLGIVFIVLKLTGLINWSWIWVLAPIWIPIAIGLFVLIVFILFCVFGYVKSKLFKL